MNNKVLKSLSESIQTSLLDAEISSDTQYQFQIISNDFLNNQKVLATLSDELKKCKSFAISVAFINSSGLESLLTILKDLEKRKIPGRILTTNYLTFTQPKALEKINSFKNIELRMFWTDNKFSGFHTKGYIFDNDETVTFLIGSSNLTESALSLNKEWNAKITSSKRGKFAILVKKEFESLWNSPNSKKYCDFIEIYTNDYLAKTQFEFQRKLSLYPLLTDLKPNKMQTEFITNLKELINSGKQRALLISATATGKTYASAFALKELQFKKVLFVVHRERIARDAQESYKNVLGQNFSYGLVSGTSKDFKKDYIFSTIQTLSKNEVLKEFSPNQFDFIVIDEVHRAGAKSYEKIMEYFKPKFWLGMSATPDRTDSYDIYKLFHNNISLEITLQRALEENLTVTFHYFGITDLEIGGKSYIGDDVKDFMKLASDERVKHIIEQAKFYGHGGNRVKGLVFCKNRSEAKELSKKFNALGFKTVALSGEDSDQKRSDAIDLLESDDLNNYLDYIFSVDIFNEGVDIPEVNQIILLRPTQSPIIFVQQLGRGLRKTKNGIKEYVVVLDFVGNYLNNFMIPLALSGDRSYNKDFLRNFVCEGYKFLPGSSTIQFDEIAKFQILTSIDRANFNEVSLIKNNYNLLKNKIGRIPRIIDFDTYNSIDPLKIFENKTLGSYHNFLSKYETDYHVKFDVLKSNILSFISQRFASGKRPHELLALKLMIDGTKDLFSDLKQLLFQRFNVQFGDNTVNNLINIFSNTFDTGISKDTFKECVLISKENSTYRISQTFLKSLEDQEFKNQIKDLIEFGLMRYSSKYFDFYEGTSFKLYEKYTYYEVARLLDWNQSQVALNIGGYKYDKITNTFPIFINYDKHNELKASINYEDDLITPNHLIAISKSKRDLTSQDIKIIQNATKNNTQIHLFIRKNKEDKNSSKEFYYLGKIVPIGKFEEFIMPNTNNVKAVKIHYKLITPVREDLYDYLKNVKL
ncbi:DEAD/DEAH box helicase [[Mycoplasma] testudinis]|uniref:DEAD/DEAH box helicase n=1 Tax=[Mycoplasma] testudinis TaxID=33924 RepID=UPI00056D84F9|nr:DEAD/DEAH box helicase [[Mycoplasma] testudinis]